MAQKTKLSESTAVQELGVGGSTVGFLGQLHGDDFLRELRGRRGINKFREMEMNNDIIGSVLHAINMIVRQTDIVVEPANDSEEAKREKQFVESLFVDMEHSWDDAVTNALTFLPYGFSILEVVYKKREGPETRSKARNSRFSDGRIGIRKLSPRAQWTIERFEMEPQGDILGVYQENTSFGAVSPFIPVNKFLHFRTRAVNDDPAGRSLLRNAYKPYYFLTHIQEIEAIAIERELNGIPVVELPASYMASDATDAQKAVRSKLERIGRDLKFNEQGFIMLPSDTYEDQDGNPTNTKMVNIRLISSDGSRNIDIDPVVKRYQSDIARTVLADFVMLGSNDRGSFALSKSKVDIFVKATQGYMESIAGVLNKQLLPRVWELNGLDHDLMPTIKAGDVAGADLTVLGRFIRASGLSEKVGTDNILEDALRERAELPRTTVEQSTERDSIS